MALPRQRNGSDPLRAEPDRPDPPWANVKQSYGGFAHDPKGRRLKIALR